MAVSDLVDLYEAKAFDGATLRAVAEELFSVANLDWPTALASAPRSTTPSHQRHRARDIITVAAHIGRGHLT